MTSLHSLMLHPPISSTLANALRDRSSLAYQSGHADPCGLKALARARGWFDDLISGRVRSLAEIASRERISRRYVERLSRLAFAAPTIVEAICQGRQPAELSTETLLNRTDLPLEWPAQRKLIGIN